MRIKEPLLVTKNCTVISRRLESIANCIRGFERKQKLTRSQQIDFSIETQLLRTSACIKYGVWVTECGEWICDCGAVVGQDYKGLFFLRLLLFSFTKCFRVLLGFDDYLPIQ